MSWGRSTRVWTRVSVARQSSTSSRTTRRRVPHHRPFGHGRDPAPVEAVPGDQPGEHDPGQADQPQQCAAPCRSLPGQQVEKAFHLAARGPGEEGRIETVEDRKALGPQLGVPGVLLTVDIEKQAGFGHRLRHHPGAEHLEEASLDPLVGADDRGLGLQGERTTAVRPHRTGARVVWAGASASAPSPATGTPRIDRHRRRHRGSWPSVRAPAAAAAPSR